MRTIKTKIYLTLIYTFLILLSLVIIYPFLWMVFASFNLSDSAIFSNNMFQIFNFKNFGLSNYYDVLQLYDPSLLKMLANSIITTFGATSLNIIVCLFASYILAKHNVWGGKFVFGFFMALMVIPQQIISIPLYLTINSLGLINSYQGIIYSLSAEALSIIILYRFFKEIPNEIIEAAYIDGANEFQLITRIALPIAKPAIMSASIVQFVGAWNAFIIPLVLVVDSKFYTLQIGITYFNSGYQIDFRNIMALSSIITVPIIIMYIISQKNIIRGITAGSIKS